MTTPQRVSGAGDVTVVICAHTTRRCEDLRRAVGSVLDQAPRPEVVLVVDHHDELLAWARAGFPDVRVVPSRAPRGLSGARNTGVAEAGGDVVAFLDDDAVADPGWVAGLRWHYRDPAVWGVGGSARPEWPGGRRPRWFPPEFDWVVGCSYVGLPARPEPVRNVIGANMSYRRAAFDRVGGFTLGLGRVGSTPLGCEETEFGIRVRDALPAARFLYDPALGVRHRVGPERATWRYFLRRCHGEGRSKAAVTRLAGTRSGLASERRYVRAVLPRGAARALSGAEGSPARAVAIVVGLVATVLGYAGGRCSPSRTPDRAPAPAVTRVGRAL